MGFNVANGINVVNVADVDNEIYVPYVIYEVHGFNVVIGETGGASFCLIRLLWSMGKPAFPGVFFENQTRQADDGNINRV